MKIEPFSAEYGEQVIRLIVGIQRGEFGIPITAEEQPDLKDIPGFYRRGNGNFWVAVEAGRVLGTISLLDIGEGRGALRKMFVDSAHRGPEAGIAGKLLERLMAWAAERGMGEILLGTTPKFLAAHRFYEKNGFREIPVGTLPPSFPVMKVDTKFYRRSL